MAEHHPPTADWGWQVAARGCLGWRLHAALWLLLIPAGWSCRGRSSGEPPPAVESPSGEDAGLMPAPAEPTEPAAGCRVVRDPVAVSPPTAKAQAPSLAWGPGVLGVAYVADFGDRSLLTLDRWMAGERVGAPIVVGDGAARAPTALVWTGDAFVFAWGEPRELTPELSVGRVDAAGVVQWEPSRLTETLRTGRWRGPGRTTVESRDARLLVEDDRLILSWRTRTYPESDVLCFATASGVKVSAPVEVTGEKDFVADHHLVPWGSGVALAYLGRFSRTQRMVRIARLALDPPAVVEDRAVAELTEPPDWSELQAVPAGGDLLLLWRVRTEWMTPSNVAILRVSPDGAAEPFAVPGSVEGVRAATPRTNLPRRTFAAVAHPDGGFVLAWALQPKRPQDGNVELRIGRFDDQGRALGESAAVFTDPRLPRDPMLIRGADSLLWFAYVLGEPPAEPGRVMLGAARCDP